MLLQDLGGPARPMTNAAEQLNLALVELAIQGERPRCSDPVDHALWISDDGRGER
jgi:hypothetical protein